MSSGPTYAAVAAGRVAGDTQASDWAAQNSLRAQRHDATSEETPLLRDDDQRDGRRVSTWEGDADFDGVKRWRRPSVIMPETEWQSTQALTRFRSSGYYRHSSCLP